MRATLPVVTTFLLTLSGLAKADNIVLYRTIPEALPPNVASQPFQAQQTAEFGDFIQLAYYGAEHPLYSVAVVVSDWAYESTYEAVGTSSGYLVPMTLTLYNPGDGIVPGSVIGASQTEAFIPWRPEPSAGCGEAWLASDGHCYNGALSTVIFGFDGLALPQQLIWGLAFNTQSWGYQPTGTPGPYNSLNVAVTTTGPSVGTDVNPDAVFWNTSTAGYYSDGGAAGAGIFRSDSGWSPYSPMVQFNTPEPSQPVVDRGRTYRPRRVA
jgi:hypothetical protein